MQETIDRTYPDVQNIKKKLSTLNEERTHLIFSLVHAKSMVHGLPHSVYKKCGKKNCRCNRGRLHGPYPALSINKNGRQRIVMLKKDSDALLQKRAKRYRHFQETLAKIRKINRGIDYLLNIIKLTTTARYSES